MVLSSLRYVCEGNSFYDRTKPVFVLFHWTETCPSYSKLNHKKFAQGLITGKRGGNNFRYGFLVNILKEEKCPKLPIEANDRSRKKLNPWLSCNWLKF